MKHGENLHRTVPIEREGAALDRAALAVVVVHGRHQHRAYMRDNVIDRLHRTDIAYILPAAHEQTWYPDSFLKPRALNQPRLDWALQRMEDVRQLLRDEGVEDARIVWLGFSQGACILAEYVAQASSRFGALVCFTGGLIGPAEAQLTRPVGVAGMPALFATSDVDALVPLRRVEKTASIYRSAGADVELAVSPGAAHEIVDDAIARCGTLLDQLARGRVPR